MSTYGQTQDPVAKLRLAKAVAKGAPGGVTDVNPYYQGGQPQPSAVSPPVQGPVPGAPRMSPGMPTGGGAAAPAIAPPNITPPIMPDWRAAAGGQAAAPAAPAPAAGTPDPLAETRHKIEMARYRREASGDAMRALDTPFVGLSPAEQEDRIGQIRFAQRRRDIYNGAEAPSIHPQSPEQIRGGQADLNKQGVDLIDSQIKALMPKFNEPNADRAALQTQFEGLLRQKQTFMNRADSATAIAGPEHDASVAAAEQSSAAQGKLREKQDTTRAAYGEMADADMTRQMKQIAMRRRIQELGGESAVAGLETGIAQTRQAGAEATVGSDPTIIKNNIKMRQAQAASAAAKAGSLGQGEAAMAQTTGAYAQAKITNPEQFMQSGAQAASSLSDLAPRNVLAGSSQGRIHSTNQNDFGRVSGLISSHVEPLERLAKLDPEEAAKVAGSLLSSLPPAANDGTYVGNDPYGYDTGTRVMRSKQVAQKLTEIRQRLEKIAGGGSAPQ